MSHASRERLQMENRARSVRLHRRRLEILEDLGRGADDNYLVLEESAFAVIGAPKLRIENFVERPRRIGILLGKAKGMRSPVANDVARVAQLHQSASRKRFKNLLAGKGLETGHVPLGAREVDGADQSIHRVRPEIDEPNPIVLKLRRRNKRLIRDHDLARPAFIDVRAHDYAIPIFLERVAKCRIAIVRRVSDKVEHNQARTGAEKPVEQQRPDCPRPREWPLGHQLEGAISSQFFRQQWRQLQRALVDPEKNKIGPGSGLATLPLEKILVILLLPPNRGDEGKVGQKMGCQDQARTEPANRRYDEAPMTTKPLHSKDFRSRARPRPCNSARTVEAGSRDRQILVSTKNPATLPARERPMTPR